METARVIASKAECAVIWVIMIFSSYAFDWLVYPVHCVSKRPRRDRHVVRRSPRRRTQSPQARSAHRRSNRVRYRWGLDAKSHPGGFAAGVSGGKGSGTPPPQYSTPSMNHRPRHRERWPSVPPRTSETRPRLLPAGLIRLDERSCTNQAMVCKDRSNISIIGYGANQGPAPTYSTATDMPLKKAGHKNSRGKNHDQTRAHALLHRGNYRRGRSRWRLGYRKDCCNLRPTSRFVGCGCGCSSRGSGGRGLVRDDSGRINVGVKRLRTGHPSGAANAEPRSEHIHSAT